MWWFLGWAGGVQLAGWVLSASMSDGVFGNQGSGNRLYSSRHLRAD